MIIKAQSAPAAQDEQLQLLRRLDTKLDKLDCNLDRFRQEARKDAVVYGAAAGALTSGIITLGMAFARAQLGL